MIKENSNVPRQTMEDLIDLRSVDDISADWKSKNDANMTKTSLLSKEEAEDYFLQLNDTSFGQLEDIGQQTDILQLEEDEGFEGLNVSVPNGFSFASEGIKDDQELFPSTVTIRSQHPDLIKDLLSDHKKLYQDTPFDEAEEINNEKSINLDALKSPRVQQLSLEASAMRSSRLKTPERHNQWTLPDSITNTPEGGSYILASSFLEDQTPNPVSSVRRLQLTARRSGMEGWSKTPSSKLRQTAMNANSPSLTVLVEGSSEILLENVTQNDFNQPSSKMPWDISLNTLTEYSNEEESVQLEDPKTVENDSPQEACDLFSLLRNDLQEPPAETTESHHVSFSLRNEEEEEEDPLSKYQHATREISRLRGAVSELESSKFELEEEIEKTRIDMSEKIETLSEVETLKSENTKLCNDIKHMKNTILKLKEQVESLEAEKSKYLSKVESAKSSNSVVLKELEQYKAELEDIKRGRDNSKKELDHLKTVNLNIRGDYNSALKDLNAQKEINQCNANMLESLRKDLEEMKAAKSAMYNEKVKLSKEVEKKSQENERLSKTLESEKKDASFWKNEATFWKDSATRFDLTMSNLKRQNEELIMELEETRTKLNAMNTFMTEKESLASELKDWKQKYDMLLSSDSEFRDQYQKMNETQQDLNKQVVKLTQAAHDAENEMKRLKQELKSSKDAEKGFMTEISDLKLLVELAESSAKESESREKDLESRLKLTSEKLSSAESKILELDSENKHFEEQHKRSMEDIRSFRKQMGELEFKMVELEMSKENETREVELLRSQLAQLESERDKERNHTELAQNGSMALMDQLDEQKAKYNKLIDEYEADLLSRQKLCEELVMVKEKMTAAESRLNAEMSALAQKEKDLQTCVQERDDLSKKLEESTATLKEMKREVELVKEMLSVAQEEESRRKSEVDLANMDLDSQRKRASDVEKHMEEYTNQLQELKGENEHIQSKYNGLLEENSTLRCQLEQVFTSNDDMMRDNQELLDAAHKLEQVVKSQSLEIQELCEQINRSKLEPHQEIEQLRKELGKNREINRAWRMAHEKNKIAVSLFKQKKIDEVEALKAKYVEALTASQQVIFLTKSHSSTDPDIQKLSNLLQFRIKELSE